MIIAYIFPASVAASSDPARFDNLLGTQWYGIYMQGGKIGYASMTLEKVNQPVDGWRFRNDMVMVASMLGATDTITVVDTRIFRSPNGELYSTRLVMPSGTGVMTVEGKKEADEFIAELNIGGRSSKKTFPYPVDYIDSLLFIPEYILSGKAAAGDTLSCSYFEPTPPITGVVTQKITIDSISQYIFNGVPTEVYSISWFVPQLNLAGRTLVDADGNDLETTLGGGMLMKLEPEAEAKTLDSDFDFLANNIIHSKKKIHDPRSLTDLKLIISGIGENDILNTKNQTVSAASPDSFVVEIRRTELPSNVLSLPIESPHVQPFLEPGPFIQSSDDEIVALAKQIVGDETDSWEAARRINRWVYENIEKKFTPDMSNALQTLHSRQGDCGEHAALTVALMRAAGIPSRPVVGLVYWPPGNGFGYHAWTEVFVGDWMMMDSSWGEDIANPAHIAMATGNLRAQISMVGRVLGKINIEVVEAN